MEIEQDNRQATISIRSDLSLRSSSDSVLSVDLCYVRVDRSVIEPATYQSQVQRPTYRYTTTQRLAWYMLRPRECLYMTRRCSVETAGRIQMVFGTETIVDLFYSVF